MNNLSVLHRNPRNIPLSRDLAEHIAERSVYGRVVVATDSPVSMLSNVRKQWVRMLRKLNVERARTLNHKTINHISYELVRLQEMDFSAKVTDAMEGCDVVFATADDLVRIAPDCSTLYVTYEFSKEKLYLMTSWMPRSALVVIYG